LRVKDGELSTVERKKEEKGGASGGQETDLLRHRRRVGDHLQTNKIAEEGQEGKTKFSSQKKRGIRGKKTGEGEEVVIFDQI